MKKTAISLFVTSCLFLSSAQTYVYDGLLRQIAENLKHEKARIEENRMRLVKGAEDEDVQAQPDATGLEDESGRQALINIGHMMGNYLIINPELLIEDERDTYGQTRRNLEIHIAKIRSMIKKIGFNMPQDELVRIARESLDGVQNRLDALRGTYGIPQNYNPIDEDSLGFAGATVVERLKRIKDQAKRKEVAKDFYTRYYNMQILPTMITSNLFMRHAKDLRFDKENKPDWVTREYEPMMNRMTNLLTIDDDENELLTDLVFPENLPRQEFTREKNGPVYKRRDVQIAVAALLLGGGGYALYNRLKQSDRFKYGILGIKLSEYKARELAQDLASMSKADRISKLNTFSSANQERLRILLKNMGVAV